MKHTTHKPQTPASSRILTTADLARITGGDVYMHNIRGSNNRLDETP